MKKIMLIILLSLFLVSCSKTQRYEGSELKEYREHHEFFGFKSDNRYFYPDVKTYLINSLKQFNKYAKKDPALVEFQPWEKFDIKKRVTEDEDFLKENTIIIVNTWLYSGYSMLVVEFEVNGKNLNITLEHEKGKSISRAGRFYSFWFIMAKNTVIKKVNPTLLFD